MFIRKINRFQHQSVQIDSIAVDPHGKFFSIFNKFNDILILIQIRPLLHYFEQYRRQFPVTKNYSLQQNIPTVLNLKPTFPTQGIISINISQKHQKSQYIVMVYLTLIEVVEIQNESFKILSKKIYTLPFEIIYGHLVQKYIYVSMFNITMAAIDMTKTSLYKSKFLQTDTISVSQKQFITKPSANIQSFNKKQLIRIAQKDQDNLQLWQTGSGILMLGDTIIGTQFLEDLDISNSTEQYTYRQGSQFFPIKYYLSHCKQFLLGYDVGKNFDIKKGGQIPVYTIRSNFGNWGKIISLRHHPQLNHFWTFHLQYQKTKAKGQKLGYEKTAMIAYYNKQQNQLVISWILVNYCERKKTDIIHTQKMSGQLFQETNIKYPSKQKIIISTKNIKQKIMMIKWIGLFHLLYFDQQGNLFFVQLNLQLLDQQ